MTKLGMDAAAVRALAAQLQAQAERLDRTAASVDGTVSRALLVWHGNVAANFAQQWRNQFRPALMRAQDSIAQLAESARRNAAEQERISAGAGATDALHAPRTVPNMLRSIDQLYHDNGRKDGFAVQKVLGPDGHVRYLVMITGVHQPALNGDGHDLDNSAWEELTHNGRIEGQIRATLQSMGVPKGADVALVGHSQGGIVAMNLAEDPSFRAHYHVTDVATFGSPVQSQVDELPKGDIANYLWVRDPLDPVPYSDVALRPSVPAEFAMRDWDFWRHDDGLRVGITGIGANDADPAAAVNVVTGYDHSAHAVPNYESILAAQDGNAGYQNFVRSMQQYDGTILETRTHTGTSAGDIES